ncbi:MAG: hypothetical protein A2Y14_04325 [Verrucomicrobia bacterium GWF2_51_19]|nr:MAG: hypothetical protein A2Y14_04325 [Verrucomicrobia bacterium GWF2_51_19]
MKTDSAIGQSSLTRQRAPRQLPKRNRSGIKSSAFSAARSLQIRALARSILNRDIHTDHGLFTKEETIITAALTAHGKRSLQKVL